MAQRQRSTRAGEGTTESEGLRNNATSTISSSNLGPAPKHPLHLSPSPSGSHSQESSAIITRRRRRQEGTSEGSNLNGDGNLYDPKEKRDHDRPKPTTLDKLEGWFGISNGESSTADSRPPTNKGSIPRSGRPPIPGTSRTTQLVIVHNVTPTDSLESLALRFNTDVRTLRKANGLWPGDSVQVRKEVYVPVDEEEAQKYNGVHQANEGLGGKLMLLNNQSSGSSSNGMLPSGSKSAASASSASAASHSYNNNQFALPSPEVRRVPSEALSYFPPPGSSTARKGKGRQENAFAYGEGMRVGRDVDHGESGVDDLLQLAEKARSRGSSPPSNVIEGVLEERKTFVQREESEADSPSSSTRALEEPWKPNKWTIGKKKSFRKEALAPSANSPASTSTSLPDVTARGPAMMATSSYQGWNDIPEPPLHRSAKGQVAHAYKGASKSRRYPRPGGIGNLTGSGAIIEDLAAGLPANPGPASNWARPITLPLPGDGSASNNGSRRERMGPSLQSNVGWAQILSDTVRGKIGLEEALERGFEDIRHLTSNTNTQVMNSESGRRALLQHSTSLASTTSQRPSAELARVTLAEGQTSQPNETILAVNGLEVRRSSGRSMHELEDLAVVDDERRKNWSSTWAPAGGSNGNGDSSANVRGRRNVRNIDWLG